MINRPGTPETYVELVRQALFEIDELRAAIEYDMKESAIYGKHAATGCICQPFRDLLNLINDDQRKGLEVE